MLYNIENLLKDLELTDKEKEDLLKELRNEFPRDEMLFELHLYRVVKYLKKHKSQK